MSRENQDELKDLLKESLVELKKDIVDELKNYIDSSINDKFKNSKPDMIFDTVDEKIGKKSKVIVEAMIDKQKPEFDSETLNKIRDDKSDFRKAVDTIQESIINSTEYENKPKVIQNKLPIFDKNPRVGIDNLFAGAGVFSFGGMIGNKFDSKNNEEIQESLVDKRRLFLETYPVKSYDEFIERLKAIDPNTNYETLAEVEKDKNVNYYNEVLLDIYDDMKSMEYYKIAKTINENKSFKYGLPYVNQDFSVYTLSNDLKNILKSRGLSLEKLGELIKVSKNTMTAIVNNKNTSSENMFKISVVLQLPIESIFRYELIFDKYIREFLERESLQRSIENDD